MFFLQNIISKYDATTKRIDYLLHETKNCEKKFVEMKNDFRYEKNIDMKKILHKNK